MNIALKPETSILKLLSIAMAFLLAISTMIFVPVAGFILLIYLLCPTSPYPSDADLQNLVADRKYELVKLENMMKEDEIFVITSNMINYCGVGNFYAFMPGDSLSKEAKIKYDIPIKFNKSRYHEYMKAMKKIGVYRVHYDKNAVSYDIYFCGGMLTKAVNKGLWYSPNGPPEGYREVKETDKYDIMEGYNAVYRDLGDGWYILYTYI